MPARPNKEQQRRFVEAFMGPARGNATKAAILAGYSPKTARQQASMLLTRLNIQRAIVGRQRRREEKAIADEHERDAVLTEIIRRGSEAGRIRAAAEINKCTGRHSITHVMKGRLTLEQALTKAIEK